MAPARAIEDLGFEAVPDAIGAIHIRRLVHSAFRSDAPGIRCLLDLNEVRLTATLVRERLTEAGHLPAGSLAIQAIAFDKTATANWKVTWHQDLMFPFSRPIVAPGYDLPSIKDGVHYARPPRRILERLLAVRLHLDDCGEANGPLRVSPGTHRLGIVPSAEIGRVVAKHGERICVARAGDALLMSPLLLHASSRAPVPGHRRVLHLVFHLGEAHDVPWHRAV